MQIPTWLAWAAPYVDLAQQNAQHVAVGAGIVGALIATRTIRRYIKTREHDEIAANLGVLLFLIVTTEGMWEVVYHKLDVSWPLAVAMFAAYDTVIYGERAAALKALAKARDARIGGHLAVIWGLSIAASITVSFASGNTATWFFRFFSPLVGAALATQKILAKRGGEAKQESNWIWTPDRLLVRWGLKKPGAVDDLSDVFAQRRIVALVDAGMELHVQQQAARLHGDRPAEPARWWRRRQQDPLAVALRRLQQLTKAADADTVAAAREQLRRVLSIEVELFRDDSQPTATERELMDELRLVMRQATTTLRQEHRAAFGPAQPAAQIEDRREVGGIRMPAHIAAQIPAQIPADWVAQHQPKPAAQVLPTALPNPAAQNLPNIPAVELPNSGPAAQPSTRASVPAERSATVQQTTVRVDRAKPVSPAAGGEVPPRVQAMVRELKRTYRGEIPGRAEVMKRLGWTSNGDAGQAIKLVREERAAKNTKES